MFHLFQCSIRKRDSSSINIAPLFLFFFPQSSLWLWNQAESVVEVLLKRNESFLKNPALFFFARAPPRKHLRKTSMRLLVSVFTHGACICQAAHGTKGSLLCDTKGECYQVQIECKLSAFFMWWCCETVEATTGMCKGLGKHWGWCDKLASCEFLLHVDTV